MRIERVGIDGPLLMIPEVHGDTRGFFVETFRADDVADAGIGEAFVQHNQSRSVRGTLRGLHFQVPPGQSKLVRVARGSIHDVVVDIRRGSRTFGRHSQVRLDDVTHHQLYIPPGFAHGFCVVSEFADVVYSVSSYYDAALERGLAWNDPALGIEWPVSDPVLSARDEQNPRLGDLELDLTRW